jgi:hypothetical protein
VSKAFAGAVLELERLIQNYPFYEHPPNVAFLISRAVVDPALPMMIID